MRSELQFFMRPEDEAEFLDHAKHDLGLQLVGKGSINSLESPDGVIQFLRSSQFASTLTAGRIALATTDLDGRCHSPETASKIERIYNRLRRWLKAHYTNRMVCYNEHIPVGERKVGSVRNFWLGAHAQRWLQSERQAVLRQFRDGRVVFQLESTHSTTSA